jgi:lysophospholipase L1-like esterase
LLTRIGLIGFGIFAALAAAEAVLQTGAAVVRGLGRPEPSWTSSGRRVLCVGDSNTYGLHLERSDAYPAVLQRRWSEQPGHAPVEVLNLGVPDSIPPSCAAISTRSCQLSRPPWS